MRTDLITAERNAYLRGETNKTWLLFTFLIWPFVGFIFALRTYSSPLSKKIIFAFFVLYGFTFVLNEEMDGQRYADRLVEAASHSIDDISQIATNLYDENSSLDIVQPLITFLVSRFTSSHYLLFAVFAFVFGYFYLKSVNRIYSHYTVSRTKNALVFLILFVWVNPIFQINGFRMWTAAWIFFYGTYQVVYNGNKKFLWLAIGASLVHFSFIAVNVLLILFLLLQTFIGNRITLFMVLAISTFFLSELPIDAIRSYGMLLGGAFQGKVAYLSESNIEKTAEKGQNLVWFMKIAGPSILYFLVFQTIIVYKNIKKKKMNFTENFKNLFAFALLFLSFSNLSSLVPSGGRFRTITFLLLATILVIYYSRFYISHQLKKTVLIGLAPILLHILISFRIGTATLNTVTLLPSIFIFTSLEKPIPVVEWLF